MVQVDRALAIVDRDLPIRAREMDHHVATAADIAATRVDDSERIADRDRRVDRVAALGEDPHADLGGVMLRRDDHAVLGLDRRLGLDEKRHDQGQRHQERLPPDHRVCPC